MKNTKKHLCKIAQHSGGLKECIETEKDITYDAFYRLVSSGLYTFYAYDERIKAYRYLIKNLDKNYNLPAWLHYYGVRRPL